MSKEELAKQIMAEFAKNDEPITMEEALEVAEMEITQLHASQMKELAQKEDKVEE